MIGDIIHIFAWVSIGAGSAFAVIGGIGLIRFPDFYTRIHAAGITDTAGAGFILLGLGLEAGLSLVTVKLVFILIFLLFLSPTSTHAVAHGAFATGLRPRQGAELEETDTLIDAESGESARS